MPFAGKLVSEFNINVPAEKFYKTFKDGCFHFPTMSPKFIKQVEVHEGDWDNHGHGSIRIWNYTTTDGKAEVLKEQVEFEDEKLMVKKIGLEGDVMNDYKTIKAGYQLVAKSHKLSLLILTIEYEKLHNDSPHPYKYMDILIGITKDVESHFN